MSKNITDIEKEIMNKIDQGEIKMRPRVYFVIGSIFTFLGLIFAVITSTFLISLVRFSLRAQGKMAQYKLDQLIENFPWWTLVFAVVGLIVGIWLIRRYDFSYKLKPWIMILGFVLAVIIAGWLLDITGFNEIVSQRGPMKGMMSGYIQTNR